MEPSSSQLWGSIDQGDDVIAVVSHLTSEQWSELETATDKSTQGDGELTCRSLYTG